MDAIDKLTELSLDAYPYEEVKELLQDFGKVGVILTTLHKGKVIIRARINGKNEAFSKTSDLSFKPQKYNKTYQRASTPNRTMFYGSIPFEIGSETQTEPFPRITTLFELSKFAWVKKLRGRQKITFSAWEVMEDVKLVSFVHYKKFERQNDLIVKLQKDYEEWIRQYPEYAETSLKATAFLGEQFAKPVKRGKDYNYLISAICSEWMTEKGFDGVLYPSVKMDGDGINVAITPEAVSGKIKLIHVAECYLYVNKKQLFLGNDTIGQIDDSGKISYEQAPKEYYSSLDECLGKVGLTLSDIEDSIWNPEYQAYLFKKRKNIHNQAVKKYVPMPKKKVGKSIMKKRRIRKRKRHTMGL
jgi:hypothetical protein